MLKTLKALQDILGRFQDPEVQADVLLAPATRWPGAGAAPRR